MKHPQLLLLAALAPLAAQAQQPGRNTTRGTIQEAEIEIVKERVNQLPEATRNFEKIRLPPPPKPERKVAYTFPDFRLPADRLNPSVRVLTIRAEEAAPLTGNYLKLGVGNYGTFYGRAHLHATRNEQYNYGFDLRHQNSATGPVDGRNSGVGQTTASLSGELYRGSATFGAALDVGRERYHYYGYRLRPNAEPPAREALAQTYTRVAARAYARNRAPADAPLQYEASLGYRYWKAAADSGATEGNVLLAGKLGYALGATGRLTLDANASFVSDQDAFATRSRTFLLATPAYELTRDKLSLTLGATVGYSGDTLGGNGRGAIYPAVRLGYALAPEKFVVYAGAGGGIQRVTRYDLTQENPWLAAGLNGRRTFNSGPVVDTRRGPTLYAGFSSTPVRNLEFNARVTYGRDRNLYFFRNWVLTPATLPNAIFSGERFELVYSPGTTSLLNVHAEVLYNAAERYRIGFKADYNHYGNLSQDFRWGAAPNDERVPYGRPAFNSTLYGTYNVFDKLMLGADFYFISGNYGATPSPQLAPFVALQTETVVDLNLRAEYRITPQFSIFALGNNLANRRYQRFLNYPVKGINAVVGAGYTF